MAKPTYLCGVALALFCLSGARAQHPLLDMVANKVIQKYQQASCEQLWQQKSEPKSQQEQKFTQLLRDDANMRTEFLNRVAAPIANKMFACGMIP